MRPPPTPRTAAAPASALELAQCLAKTRTTPQGATTAGRSVEEHCRIAGAVAAELARRFEEACPGLLPTGSELPALVHDVGKVCPTFQAKIYDAVGERPPELANAAPRLEQQWGGHATVSHAALCAFGAPKAIARIAGEHHGKKIKPQWRVYPGDAEIFGCTLWQKKREELLHHLLPENPQWPHLDDEARERMLCGLTITADWIASGRMFDDPCSKDWQPLINRAVDEAGFYWPQVLSGLSFQDIFGFAPRPAQSALIDAIQNHGVYVLEAPMGLGKTEAALYAAYRMLEQRKSSGIYFALPTRLTSNRIHARVNRFLARIFAGSPRALLLHGQAWLEQFESERGKKAEWLDCFDGLQQFGSVGKRNDTSNQDDMPDLSWFTQGKRGILAPFAVGTVDQALLSAMHVRHGALRTFGLAGKTVILDEVHSYDAYTGTILDALVEQLRRLNCTVIILSATLTAERRAALLQRAGSNSADYPLISAAPLAGSTFTKKCEAPAESQTLLGHPASDEEAVEEALLRAEGGQRVLWIENTVGEAQARWRLLAARAAEIGVPCGLLHSRFTPADRETNETKWTALFAHTASGRGTQGALLVGTQVVEQSLDLDADFLITRFCPTDMLLQRLGRLWRHEDTERPPNARREAWLLHPAWTEAQEKPKTAFGSSGSVYAPYVLARSLEHWHARTAINLPSEIRTIIETTYADRTESGIMLTAKFDLEKKREKLKMHALSAATAAQPELEDNDDNLPTRWSERIEVAVLLLRSWCKTERRLTLADGTEMTLPPDDGRRHWRSAEAAKLLRNMVRISLSEKIEPDKWPVPLATTPAEFAPWLNCQQVHPAKLDESGAVRDLNGNCLAHNPCYTKELGYHFERSRKK